MIEIKRCSDGSQCACATVRHILLSLFLHNANWP